MKKSTKRSFFTDLQKILLLCAAAVAVFFGYTYLSFFRVPPCANSISCTKDLSGVYDPTNQQGVFMGRTVSSPSYVAEFPSQNPVLGESTGSNKHIFVDLTNQRLYAFEGNKLIYNFLVSTGKWGKTPTGDFHIWVKLRYTRMTGGNPAIGTFYDLPNVPYTMYFYNNEVPRSRGYGLHGAYWHNNFGHPMSHGCINISIPNSEFLYNWANPPTTGSTTYAADDNPGTLLTIYGIAPND